MPATPTRSETIRRKHKSGFKRSKTGCLTCRQRHVKCVEEHPRCSRCVRLNLDCQWPLSPSNRNRTGDANSTHVSLDLTLVHGMNSARGDDRSGVGESEYGVVGVIGGDAIGCGGNGAEIPFQYQEFLDFSPGFGTNAAPGFLMQQYMAMLPILETIDDFEQSSDTQPDMNSPSGDDSGVVFGEVPPNTGPQFVCMYGYDSEERE